MQEFDADAPLSPRREILTTTKMYKVLKEESTVVGSTVHCNKFQIGIGSQIFNIIFKVQFNLTVFVYM